MTIHYSISRSRRLATAFAVCALSSWSIAGDVTAKVILPISLEVEVGAPFEVVLEGRLVVDATPKGPPRGGDIFAVEREARSQLAELFEVSPFSEETLDYSWTILSAGKPVIDVETDGGEDGPRTLVVRSKWTLASLEAGERALPMPAWEGIEVQGAELILFRSLLAEAEDEARPLAGFPELPPLRVDGEQTEAWMYIVPGAVLILLAGFLLGRRSRAETRKDPKALRQSIDAELESLRGLAAPGTKASSDEIRAGYFALTRLVRVSAELRSPHVASLVRVGMTDMEWAEAVGASDETRELFAEAGFIKYGGDLATCWGLAERLAVVTSLCADDQVARGGA